MKLFRHIVIGAILLAFLGCKEQKSVETETPSPSGGEIATKKVQSSDDPSPPANAFGVKLGKVREIRATDDFKSEGKKIKLKCETKKTPNAVATGITGKHGVANGNERKMLKIQLACGTLKTDGTCGAPEFLSKSCGKGIAADVKIRRSNKGEKEYVLTGIDPYYKDGIVWNMKMYHSKINVSKHISMSKPKIKEFLDPGSSDSVTAKKSSLQCGKNEVMVGLSASCHERVSHIDAIYCARVKPAEKE